MMDMLEVGNYRMMLINLLKVLTMKMNLLNINLKMKFIAWNGTV
ncbi:MAG: hypothetical protein ACK52J_01155 [bacterium]